VLPKGHSLLVVGPTQVGKTSAIVVPAVLRWPGPLVVTSVKRDVCERTEAWRATLGTVVALEPGRSDGATFDPLEGVTGHRAALAAARDLASAAFTKVSAETEFWNVLAVKLLGALFALVRESGGTIYDVVAALGDRRYEDPACTARESSVAAALAALRDHEPRTADAVATTAEALLAPWQLRQPLAAIGSLLTGANTLYLVAPRHEQRRYATLFAGVLARVIADQQASREAGDGAELLLVLDEAAAVAPLEDLDQLAATGSGIGITLVTVFQDFAQIEARWGDRAATIVNNHATRLVLGGLVDPRVDRYLPELSPKDHGVTLRRWPRGTGALISGHRPKLTVCLVPWWRSRLTRKRAKLTSPVVTMHR
jgi:type IV secretion system protein VirD4